MVIKRKIVNILLAASMVAVVMLAGVLASHRVADPICFQISVSIKDSTERQYVTAQELQGVLRQAGLWQIGQPLSKISCQEIEHCLQSHPMLREAECHELSTGEVRIAVRQRVPLMRIDGDEHYFVDMDRTVMPVRASVNTPVMVVSGRIGRQQALGEMYDFVYMLSRNRYWRDKIHTIRVSNPKMIELVDSEHKYVIILGDLSNAELKMANLKKLYEEGFDKVGWPEYKQIDLRYANQIIGRK